MDIVLRNVRQLVVDDVRQLLDVQAAGRHFGGHQRRDAVVLEIRECAHACALALVAMDRSGADAGALQLLGQAIGTVLGAGEDQHLEPVAILDQVGQQVPLVVLWHLVDGLVHAISGRVAHRHFHRDRVVQHAVGELPDVVVVSGREHQVLALRGQHLDHAADVADEPHVEHAIGLVEDEHLHVAQVHGALLREVQQSPWGRDQQVAATAQPVDLGIDVDAAEHHLDAHRRVLAVGDRALGDLGGEFTGGREHQAARRAAVRIHAADGNGIGAEAGQLLQDGQHEGCGLAGAGLGAGQDIPALQHGRDGAGLDRGGLGVALLGNGAKQLGSKPEIGK